MGTKYFIAFSLVAALVIAPVAAVHAASLTEAQIQAVLGLLSAFGADQTTVGNVNASLRGLSVSNSTSVSSSVSATSVCAQVKSLVGTLTEGATDTTSGGAVTRLQKLLASDRTLYPEGMVTGYFGALTSKAIARCGASSQVTNTAPAPTIVAGSKSPSCTWHVNKVALSPGEEFTMSWTSENATSAVGPDGSALDVNGEKVLSANIPGPYQYAITFVGPGGRVTCTATVTIAGDTPVVATPKGKGTLNSNTVSAVGTVFSGTLTDYPEAVVYLYKNGGIFTNGKVVAVDGTWTYKPGVPLTPGAAYLLYLYGYPGNVLLMTETISAI